MTQGLARAGFDLDLRYGQGREDALGYVLLRAKVEHKSDQKCRITGNFFIEYRQKGRPSGIATTTADFWALEYDTDCRIVLPTERLKAITRQAYKDSNRRVRGGDHDDYEGVLVPIEWLIRPWRRVE